MFNYMKAQELASKYEIPLEDVILIALNRYGIIANISDNRIRFKLKMDASEEIFYFAICVNTYRSPFYLDEYNHIYLEKIYVGRVLEIEKDTCDTTYFRRNGTELTLNSNMRSQCKGCKFCGTYNLESEEVTSLSNEDSLCYYLESFLKVHNLSDFKKLVRVSICTGCFADEKELVNHILMVQKAFSRFGFDKRIRYIGSQLRSEKALYELAEHISDFSLSMTVECFSRRSQLMRKEKAKLDMMQICDIMKYALELGFSTNFLYILGLDTLVEFEKGLLQLSDCINRFPIIQIMQNYVKEHEIYRTEEARDIEYYLSGRKIVEKILGEKNYRPRSWENYRSLFYLKYNGIIHEGIKI